MESTKLFENRPASETPRARRGAGRKGLLLESSFASSRPAGEKDPLPKNDRVGGNGERRGARTARRRKKEKEESDEDRGERRTKGNGTLCEFACPLLLAPPSPPLSRALLSSPLPLLLSPVVSPIPHIRPLFLVSPPPSSSPHPPRPVSLEPAARVGTLREPPTLPAPLPRDPRAPSAATRAHGQGPDARRAARAATRCEAGNGAHPPRALRARARRAAGACATVPADARPRDPRPPRGRSGPRRGARAPTGRRNARRSRALLRPTSDVPAQRLPIPRSRGAHACAEGRALASLQSPLAPPCRGQPRRPRPRARARVEGGRAAPGGGETATQTGGGWGRETTGGREGAGREPSGLSVAFDFPIVGLHGAAGPAREAERRGDRERAGGGWGQLARSRRGTKTRMGRWGEGRGRGARKKKKRSEECGWRRWSNSQQPSSGRRPQIGMGDRAW